MCSKRQPTIRRQVFGEILKNRRLDENLFQGEVAKKLGVSQATYSRIESGRHETSVTQLGKIAEILGDPAWLLMLELDEALQK